MDALRIQLAPKERRRAAKCGVTESARPPAINPLVALCALSTKLEKTCVFVVKMGILDLIIIAYIIEVEAEEARDKEEKTKKKKLLGT